MSLENFDFFWEKEFFHWNNKKGQEVDFVLKDKKNNLSGINVSYTNDIDEKS